MKMVADWFNTWIWFHVLVDAAAHEATKLAAKILAFLDTLHGKDMAWMNIDCSNPWKGLRCNYELLSAALCGGAGTEASPGHQMLVMRGSDSHSEKRRFTHTDVHQIHTYS